MRTMRFCAAVMVSAAIFIGDFSGSATGIASTRRMRSGACSRAGRENRRVFSSMTALGASSMQS
jgi:hypothetical protein